MWCHLASLLRDIRPSLDVLKCLRNETGFNNGLWLDESESDKEKNASCHIHAKTVERQRRRLEIFSYPSRPYPTPSPATLQEENVICNTQCFQWWPAHADHLDTRLPYSHLCHEASSQPTDSSLLSPLSEPSKFESHFPLQPSLTTLQQWSHRSVTLRSQVFIVSLLLCMRLPAHPSPGPGVPSSSFRVQLCSQQLFSTTHALRQTHALPVM